jgi:hypothetical protein
MWKKKIKLKRKFSDAQKEKSGKLYGEEDIRMFRFSGTRKKLFILQGLTGQAEA